MATLMFQSYCLKLQKYVNLITHRSVGLYNRSLTMNLRSTFMLTNRSFASISQCSSQFVKNRLHLTSTVFTPRYVSSYSKSSGDEPDILYKSIEIEVKGHDPAVINSYEKFVSMTAHELGVTIANIVNPYSVAWSCSSTPERIINRYTLLKSVHIFRKHMVQYEMRTLFRNIQLKNLTGSTADTLLEYIQRNLPEGMAMKVTRHAIEAIPDHIKPPKKQLTEQRT